LDFERKSDGFVMLAVWLRKGFPNIFTCKSKWKWFEGRPRTHCNIYTENLKWNHMGLHPNYGAITLPKLWRWWWTVMLGSSILSFTPATFTH